MGRTIPSWRIVVDEEFARMARFKQFLSYLAGVLASSIREVPLLLSMVFAQHKRLRELEKRLKEVHL